MKHLTTKLLARAGIIAALYVGLTVVFGELAYGPLQIRPAEALTVLPAFFPEAAVALYVGCLLANLFSGYGLPDILLGPIVSLAACLLTRLIYKKTENIFLAALPPVLLNGFLIPLIFMMTGTPWSEYWVFAGSLLLTEAVFIYTIGVGVYYSLKRLRQREIAFLQ